MSSGTAQTSAAQTTCALIRDVLKRTCSVGTPTDRVIDAFSSQIILIASIAFIDVCFMQIMEVLP